MEYGIVLERTLPTYMSELHESIENDYIPRTLAVLRWVPIVRRYVPAQTKSDKLPKKKEGLTRSPSKSKDL